MYVGNNSRGSDNNSDLGLWMQEHTVYYYLLGTTTGSIAPPSEEQEFTESKSTPSSVTHTVKLEGCAQYEVHLLLLMVVLSYWYVCNIVQRRL